MFNDYDLKRYAARALEGDIKRKTVSADLAKRNALEIDAANNAAEFGKQQAVNQTQKDINAANQTAETERAKPGMENQSIKNSILSKFGEAAAEVELNSAKTKLGDDVNTYEMNKKFGPLTKEAALKSQNMLTEDLASDIKTKRNTKRVDELNKSNSVFTAQELDRRDTLASTKAAQDRLDLGNSIDTANASSAAIDIFTDKAQKALGKPKLSFSAKLGSKLLKTGRVIADRQKSELLTGYPQPL